MKQPIILLTLCFTLLCHIAKAQTSFEETYKKAYAFTTTNTDSALFWAQKCTKIAQTQSQKYKAYYFLAYNASRKCLFGLANKGYTKAAYFAKDSSKKYKAVNSLADTYLSSGNLELALKYNQISISFFKRHKNWKSLSYSYQLKANMLYKQKNYEAIELLRKVIRLRLEYAPKEVGFAYHRLAETFHTFNILDSAIVYQQKALETYPIQTPEQRAFLRLQLAKYYIFNEQAALAKPHLQIAQSLKKRPLTQIQACHVQALYYSKTNQTQAALAEFARCDSLVESLIVAAPDVVTRQTIAEQAKQMYQDALKLKQLPKMVRIRYQNRLKINQVRLTSYRTELDLRDQIQQKELSAPRQLSPGPTNSYYWLALAGLLALVILVGGGLWWYRTSRKTPVQDPPPTLAISEQKLLDQLEAKLGQPLAKEWYYIVVVYYREGSITGTAKVLRISRNTLKARFKKISEATQLDSVKDFIDVYRREVKQDERKAKK